MRDGAAGLFFGNSGGQLTSRVTVEQSVSTRGAPEISSSTDGMVRWWVHGTRWYVAPQAALVTNTAGNAPKLAPYRGGGFDPDGSDAITDADVALLGRGGISLDLGPVDAAARGFATSGSAVTLYAEQLVAPGAGQATLELDNHTVLGTELAADLFFNTIPLRLTGGDCATRDTSFGTAAARKRSSIFNLGGLAAEQISIERKAAPTITAAPVDGTTGLAAYGRQTLNLADCWATVSTNSVFL